MVVHMDWERMIALCSPPFCWALPDSHHPFFKRMRILIRLINSLTHNS